MEIGSKHRRQSRVRYRDFYPKHIYTSDRRIDRRWAREIKKLYPRAEVLWNARDQQFDMWVRLKNGAEAMVLQMSGVRNVGPEYVETLRTCKRRVGLRMTEAQRRHVARAKARKERAFRDFEFAARDAMKDIYRRRFGGYIAVAPGYVLQ